MISYSPQNRIQQKCLCCYWLSGSSSAYYSLGLAIFGELVCSMAFIVGFLYRLAMIPMIFTMIVAFFVVHANDVFAVKELAFIYLVVFILMYIAGPGKFSIDHIIGNELLRRKSRAYKN